MPAPDSTDDCSVKAPSVEPNHLRSRKKSQVRLGDGDRGLRAQRLVGGEEQRELVFERDGERVDRARSDVHVPRAGSTGASTHRRPATTRADARAMATACRATRTAASAVTSRDDAKPQAPSASTRTPKPKLSERSTASTTPVATWIASREVSTTRTSA